MTTAETQTREYGVVGRGDMSYIFMLCSCRLNKCSISYWQSIMNFNTIKQRIEIIIIKNRWLYPLLLVSIIYLVLFYFNFTAYIGDYFEEESMVFVYTAMGVLCVEHANVLELCYIELLSGDGSPYSILSDEGLRHWGGWGCGIMKWWGWLRVKIIRGNFGESGSNVIRSLSNHLHPHRDPDPFGEHKLHGCLG